MKVLFIIAYYKGAEAGRCNYTYLAPLAYTSARQFTFKNLIINTPCVVDNSGHSYINVSIYIRNAYGLNVELNKFKIVPHEEIEFKNNGDFEVFGTITPDWYTNIYDQALVDVFHEWDSGECTVNDYPSEIIKSARLSANGKYSGLPKSIKKGDVIIDGKTISDHYDFYAILAKNLVGEKGFFGSCYNSLHDCLIESYDNENTTHIIFKNTDNINMALGSNDFKRIIELFKEHKYKVTLQ